MLRRTAILVTTLTLAGCAQVEAQGAPGPSFRPSTPESPPASSTPALPTLPIKSPPATTDRRPSNPPKGPTDTIKKTTWVVGTVTTGGNGPCYGLTTDDGVAYALHSTGGTTLTKGARMKVNTAVSRLKINCGPGKLVEMVAAQPLR